MSINFEMIHLVDKLEFNFLFFFHDMSEEYKISIIFKLKKNCSRNQKIQEYEF